MTVPLAPTFETPGTWAIAGTMLLVTIAESAGIVSEREVNERVTTVDCDGSKVRMAGAGRSAGSAARAICTRS